MHIFHKWSRWKQYNKEINFISYKLSGSLNEYTKTILRQQRMCEVCGIVQDQSIAELAEIYKAEDFEFRKDKIIMKG